MGKLRIFILLTALSLSLPLGNQAWARPRKTRLTHVAASSAACLQTAKNLKGDLHEKLENFLDCQTKKIRFSGIVLVGYDDDNLNKRNILEEKAFGFADTSAGHARLNDNTTEVLLGSVTKQFVSALTLKLISEGKLQMDTKAVTLIPEVDVFKDRRWRDITIRELLAHGSGIHDYINGDNFDDVAGRSPEVIDIIKKSAASRKLGFSPGRSARYSNTNYLILGRILEHIMKQPWAQIVETQIREPLLMNHTGIYSLSDLHTAYAVGYEQPGHITEGKHRDPKLFTAVGDMYSSVEDLFLWEHYLFSTNIVIPSQMRAQYLEAPVLKEFSAGAEVFNGLGTADTAGHQAVFKTGHLSGYANVVSYFPQDKLVVIILSNTTETKGSLFIRPLMAQLAGLVFNSEKQGVPVPSPLAGPEPALHLP